MNVPDSTSGFSVTIPKQLKAGAYLIRHEVIMLAANPAQFYPQCAHLMVTGEGTKLPSKEYLVSFPGAYQAAGQFSLMLGYSSFSRGMMSEF